MQELELLLDELGLAMGADEVEVTDYNKVENGYIHHTRVPVYVAGLAIRMPYFAMKRFPKFTFINMIQKRPSMDETEVCALALICGAEVTPPFWGNPEPFGKFLWEIIDRYDLGAFFERVEERNRYGSPGDHFLMRPRGFDWTVSWEPIPDVLKKWRSDYRKATPVRQLMAMTVLHLYNSNPDWMKHISKKWHAVDGIAILRDQGALADWAKLYALYPGW